MFRFTTEMHLKKPKEFQTVFVNGNKQYLNGITLIAYNHDSNFTRIGFAISKKQIKTAVNRNRLKRLARETFRQVAVNLQGFDFIVLVNKTCLNFNNSKLIQTYHELFHLLVRRFRC